MSVQLDNGETSHEITIVYQVRVPQRGTNAWEWIVRDMADDGCFEEWFRELWAGVDWSNHTPQAAYEFQQKMEATIQELLSKPEDWEDDSPLDRKPVTSDSMAYYLMEKSHAGDYTERVEWVHDQID